MAEGELRIVPLDAETVIAAETVGAMEAVRTAAFVNRLRHELKLGEGREDFLVVIANNYVATVLRNEK